MIIRLQLEIGKEKRAVNVKVSNESGIDYVDCIFKRVQQIIREWFIEDSNTLAKYREKYINSLTKKEKKEVEKELSEKERSFRLIYFIVEEMRNKKSYSKVCFTILR